MRVTLNVQLSSENAAFQDDNRHSELEAILVRMLARIERYETTGELVLGNLYDTNGNKVGEYQYCESEEEDDG